MIDALTTATQDATHQNCDCRYCRDNHPFEMPESVIDAYEAGELVVFAGAGVSTEARKVLDFTLHEDICASVDVDPSTISFPAAAQSFEEKFGRRRLLEEIASRFAYIRSFPELENTATDFHAELAKLFRITEIFTTNWDTYFEKICLAQPLVTAEDWAFWRVSSRRVFKLHGSLTSPASIVATSADYQIRKQTLRDDLLGAHLKSMLASKTFLFVGYSFGDEDFNQIYELLMEETKDALPRSVIVTLSEGDPPALPRGSTIIRTDATYFLQQLKSLLPSEEFVEDDRLAASTMMRRYVGQIHREMSERIRPTVFPSVIYCAVYQDGLMHAFDHQIANRGLGDYWHTCYVREQIRMYHKLIEDCRKDRNYFDSAYLTGYVNGLMWLLADEEMLDYFPFYFTFSGRSDEYFTTIDEFEDVVAVAESRHKAAHRAAKSAIARYDSSIDFHHLPTLSPSTSDLTTPQRYYGSRLDRYEGLRRRRTNNG